MLIKILNISTYRQWWFMVFHLKVLVSQFSCKIWLCPGYSTNFEDVLTGLASQFWTQFAADSVWNKLSNIFHTNLNLSHCICYIKSWIQFSSKVFNYLTTFKFQVKSDFQSKQNWQGIFLRVYRILESVRFMTSSGNFRFSKDKSIVANSFFF